MQPSSEFPSFDSGRESDKGLDADCPDSAQEYLNLDLHAKQHGEDRGAPRLSILKGDSPIDLGDQQFRILQGLVHDMNNLLAITVSHGSLGLRRLSDQDPVHGYVERSLRAAVRAAELAQQLMAQLINEPTGLTRNNVNQIIRNMVPLLEADLAQFVEIHMQLADEINPIWANESRIEQLILNLLMNAIDAIQHPAGAIHIKTSNRTMHAGELKHFISSEILAPGEYVSVEVSDNGIGIHPALLRRIFEPHFSTKRNGNGIGLTSSLAIVDMFDGGMYVRSAVGLGTTFVVIFPACL